MKFIVHHSKDFSKNKTEVEISSIEDLQKLQDSFVNPYTGAPYPIIVDFHYEFEAPDYWDNRELLPPRPAIMIYDDYIE